jgi:hypothetical protein
LWGAYCLHHQGDRQITRSNIPEDGRIHIRRRENLKFNQLKINCVRQIKLIIRMV